MTPLHTRVVEAMARAAEPHLWSTIDYYRSPLRVRDCGDLADYKSDASCGRQRAALAAAVSALAAEGWNLRPDVATEGMNLVAIENGYVDEVYPLMIAAAPSPFGEIGE